MKNKFIFKWEKEETLLIDDWMKESSQMSHLFSQEDFIFNQTNVSLKVFFSLSSFF